MQFEDTFKMKQFLKKTYIYILVFAVPVFLLVLVYALRGVYPFGKNSVLALDLNAQYIYYYEAFRDAFFSGKSLLYSFSRTLGGEMVGLYAYYLASPFSFILLLFPKEFITEAIFTIIILKVGSAALAFSIYLKQSRKAKTIPLLIFSLMYALMSYVVVETLNPMWLDGIILLPIIILGVERLINENKYGLVIVTLTALFVTNFYIGYMEGIFIFIYYLYYLFGKSEISSNSEKIKKSLLFLVSTLTSIGMSMWLLLPTYYSLKMGKFGFSNPNFSAFQKIDLFDMFSKMLPITYDSVNYQGYPFIFCGTIVLLLTAYYFVNKKIIPKEKIAAASFISIIIISFTINTLDMVLHGFQAPNWLNFRYSFVLSFFLLIIAYEGYNKLKYIKRKTFVKVAIILIFIVALIGKLNYVFIKPERTIWLVFICVIVYSALLYIIKKKPKNQIITIILMVLIMAEMFLNSYAMIDGIHNEVYYSDRPSYREYFDRIIPSIDYIKENDDGFYRAETVIKRTVNDPMALNINGISHSSSTLNVDVLNMLFKLGLASKEHWTKYKGTTILTDSLLGVKYIVSENNVTSWYKQLYEENNLTVYENPYVLPIAYISDKSILSIELDSIDPFINQNFLLSTLLGQPYTEYFKLLSINEIKFENMAASQQDGFVVYNAINPNINAHIEYILGTASNNDMYMYLYSEYPRKVNIWKNKEYVDTFFSYESICIIPLGINSNEETISLITTPIEGEYYLNNNMFYYIDMELFEKDILKIKEKDVSIQKINETHLIMETNAKAQDVLFTTIPYEEGWKVTVNGEKVETIKTLDSLIAIQLESGEQIIEFKFIPSGLVLGSVISFISILFFIILLIKRKKIEKNI